MSVTLTYDAALSRVRVDADGLDDLAAVDTVAVVERSVDQITWTVVRGGASVPVVGGVLARTVNDYEFHDGALNHYRVRPLSPGFTEGFEQAGLAFPLNPAGSDAPWGRSSAQANTGTWSLGSGSITHDQTSTQRIQLPPGAAVAQFAYIVSSEEFFDDFEFLVDDSVELSASGEVAWTASASFDVSDADTITFRYSKDGSVTEGSDAAWVDDLQVLPAFTAQTSSITPSLDGRVWLKSISWPLLNRPVVVTNYSDPTRAARNGVHQVVGRKEPVVTTDVRLSRQYTLELLASLDEDTTALDAVLDLGEVVFLHTPRNCPVPGGYWVIRDSVLLRRSTRGKRRYPSLPLTEVAPPGPAVVGTTVVWRSITRAYATWADLVNDKNTWADVVEIVADPEDVLV